MSFGRMNTLISITKEVVTKDAEGFATKGRSGVGISVRISGKGRTVPRNGSIVPPFQRRRICSRFRIIPTLNVTTAHVILCGDDRFEITSVEGVKGKGMYIEVLAKKVTPDG